MATPAMVICFSQQAWSQPGHQHQTNPEVETSGSNRICVVSFVVSFVLGDYVCKHRGCFRGIAGKAKDG
jgi:hypothetical protein